jgi:hypothetical protein
LWYNLGLIPVEGEFMADSSSSSSISLCRRSWILLALLVAVHAAFNLALNPVGASENKVSERLGLPLMGAIFAQPVLFAIWAAIGPGPAVIRIPWSLIAALTVFFASIPKQWNMFSADSLEFDGPELTIEVVPFCITFAVMLIARKATGWRIGCLAEEPNSGNASNQFSIKYLLLITAIWAVLLAIGRALMAGGFWFESSFWEEALSSAFTFAGVILLALFPLLIFPLIVIARHPSIRAFVVISVLWVGLTWLAVEILAPQFGEPRADVARQLLLLQGGAAGAGLVSAIIARCARYRLSSRPGNSSLSPVSGA